MLIVSPEFNCSQEILTIVAMLSGTLFSLHSSMRLIVFLAVPNIWVRPNNKRAEADIAKQLLSIPDGDHLTLLNVFDEYQKSMYYALYIFSPLTTKILSDLGNRNWAWKNYVSARSLAEAANVRSQILRIMERLEIGLGTEPYKNQTTRYMDIRKSLVCGYFTQVAQKSSLGNSYLTIKDNQVRPHSKIDAIPLTRISILALMQVVELHPSCCLETQPEWVLFNEFVLTTQPYIRTVTEIRPDWLLELAANYYDMQSFPDGEAKSSLQRVLKKRKRKDKNADLDAATLKMNSLQISTS